MFSMRWIGIHFDLENSSGYQNFPLGFFSDGLVVILGVLWWFLGALTQVMSPLDPRLFRPTHPSEYETYAGLALTFCLLRRRLASRSRQRPKAHKTLLPAPLLPLSAGSAQIVGRKQLQTRSVRFELCFATVGDLTSAPNTNSARGLSVLDF